MTQQIENEKFKYSENYKYSWRSPIGLGFWVISVGLFLWLLHLSKII